MCIVRERRPAGFLDMKCQTCFMSETETGFRSKMDTWDRCMPLKMSHLLQYVNCDNCTSLM